MLNGFLFLGDQNLLILVNLRVITDLVFLHSRPEDLRMVGPQAPNHFFAVCLCPRCQQKKKEWYLDLLSIQLFPRNSSCPQKTNQKQHFLQALLQVFSTPLPRKKKTKLIYILSNEIVS